MAYATNNPTIPKKPFTAEEDAALRESLKRCSPETYQSAKAFRQTRDPDCLPAIVLGIIERYVEPEVREKLRGGDDDLRVIEDLGVDSLTMMEVVILVEEVVQTSINNDELRNLRTVGDIKSFIDCKVRGLPPPTPTRFLPVEQIAAVMPIQPPFLFLNEATLSSSGATAKYKVTGQEFFFQGHFKDNPVVPASIMLEALGQLAVLYLLEGSHPELERKVDPKRIFFTSCDGVRCHRICRPGDVLTLSVKPRRIKPPLGSFEGQIRVGQEKTAFAEEITLTFGFAESTEVEETAPAAALEQPEGASA